MERVERKYLCSDYDILLLQQRLQLFLSADMHQRGKSYQVRSVYLDTPEDEGYYENENGVDERKKYRIRIYGGNSEVIKFEIKRKIRGKTGKEVWMLSKTECEEILAGKICKNEQIAFFQQEKRLRPVTVIDYERSAYVYNLGNVRITFDRNITASSEYRRFFDADMLKIPILPEHIHLMEVKYDEFLPDYIADILELGKLRQVTFSKYFIGRQKTEVIKNLV